MKTLFLIFVLLQGPAEAGRVFHPYPISVIASADPMHWKGHFFTHTQTEGFVTYKAHESDRDWHLRLCDSAGIRTMDKAHCIVLEIIPELPLPVPKLGAHIRARGIYRFDAELPGHNWAELHPLISWEAIE